jgi:uncharacterized membrane protein YbhN (UPF0104 family)
VRGASWGWVVLAVVLWALTNVADAIATRGAVARRLPLGRTVELEVAASFTGIATPGGIGTLAMKTRFFQRRGLPGVAAVTSGALVGLGGAVVQVCLLAVSYAAVGSIFDLAPTGSGGRAGSGGGWLVLAVVLVLLAVGIVRRVPSLRERVVLAAREAWHNLRTIVGTPAKLVQILGGNLASQVLFATTLGVSLLAFGGTLSLPALILVNTASTLVGGLSPTPGGLGVTEATMVAALTAAGVPHATAVPAVLLHRLVTSWLTPLPGYVAYRRLTRRGDI